MVLGGSSGFSSQVQLVKEERKEDDEDDEDEKRKQELKKRRRKGQCRAEILRGLEFNFKELFHKGLVLGGLELLVEGGHNLGPALFSILLHVRSILLLVELGKGPAHQQDEHKGRHGASGRGHLVVEVSHPSCDTLIRLLPWVTSMLLECVLELGNSPEALDRGIRVAGVSKVLKTWRHSDLKTKRKKKKRKEKKGKERKEIMEGKTKTRKERKERKERKKEREKGKKRSSNLLCNLRLRHVLNELDSGLDISNLLSWSSHHHKGVTLSRNEKATSG